MTFVMFLEITRSYKMWYAILILSNNNLLDDILGFSHSNNDKHEKLVAVSNHD